MCRVGQNRIYTLYMTVYLSSSLPKVTVHTPYIYDSGQPYKREEVMFHMLTCCALLCLMRRDRLRYGTLQRYAVCVFVPARSCEQLLRRSDIMHGLIASWFDRFMV